MLTLEGFLLNEGDGKITELQEGVWKGAERTLQKWSRLS